MTGRASGILAAAALLAFAGNSILCRAALGAGHADAATFTLVRLACGAATLGILARARGECVRPAGARGAVRVATLFGYAVLFSFAYVRVGAGVGALVLFGFVQATMLAGAVRAGRGPKGLQWLGVALAIAGLALWAVPGTTAPDPLGLALMAASGTAWGVYSLVGAGEESPLAATAAAFVGATPLALVVAAAAWALHGLSGDPTGIALAATSGALTSALAYAAWYAVLPSLGTTRAAVLQLLVPVLAALAGTLALGESPSLRLVASGATILGGIALAILPRKAA